MSLHTFERAAEHAESAHARPRSAIRPLGATRAATALPPFLREGTESAAEQLDPSVRAEMEPRFGHNFGQVRVHSDPSAQRSARALNVHAYTVGKDIVFGSGEYAPQSETSRRLIAHELAHVVQQGSGLAAPAVQAKLKSPLFPLDMYLTNNRMAEHSLFGDEYSHPGMSSTRVEEQILADLLHSPRVFTVAGNSQSETEQNIDEHISARQGIVKFVSKKKRYKFAAGAAMRMNPVYWERPAGRSWRLKPGVDRLKASEDLHVTPGAYAIACARATEMALIGGSKDSPIVEDTGVAADDWIPGDAGYIANTNFSGRREDAGQEGENLIYASNDLYWGHLGNTNTILTFGEWVKRVEGWNGSAMTLDVRRRPSRGLV